MRRFGFNPSAALVLGTVVAILVGCASAADQEAQRIGGLAKSALQNYALCSGAVMAKPQYAKLIRKLPIGLENGKVREPTPQQLADTDQFTADDIVNVMEGHAEVEVCNRQALDTFGKIDPELLVMAARQEQRVAEIITDIVSKKVTYGEVNQRIVRNRAQYRAELAPWGQKLRERIAAMRQQEAVEHEQFMAQVGAVTQTLAAVAIGAAQGMAQQQQALAQAQMNYAAAHPVYVPVHRMTVTNCQWMGRMLSCTSSSKVGAHPVAKSATATRK